MERKQNSGFVWSGTSKRMLSLILAFVMVLSLLPATDLFTQVRAAATQTVYFRDSNNWDTVYGYAWDSSNNKLLGEWPGTQLSKDSSGLYKMTVTVTGSLSFIFNNGSGSQTGDLSLSAAQVSAGQIYIVDGVSGSPVAGTPPVVQGSKVTFTYTGPASKVLLAGTMNGWTGVAMNKSGNTFTYTCELAAGTHEYKFVVDGNWISDPSNPNVTGSDHNSYVVVSGGSGSGPATSNTVKIHFQNTLGWETVCAAAWNTGAADPAMDSWNWPGQVLPLDEDGNYLLEVTPNLASGQSLGYLFHDFDQNQTVDLFVDYATVSKGNAELWVKPATVNEEEKYLCTTSTTSTASPRVEGNKVTFTYTGTASSVSVAGSFNSWSPAKMTRSGSAFTYSTTLASGIYEYKLIVDNNWIADPSNSATLGENSLLIVGDNTANPADDKITVQFHIRKTGSYTGWDAWVWDDFTGGSAYTLKTGTLSDKLVSVTVDSASTYVGFILRKSDWSDQSDTFYADLKNISSGTVHCFVDFDGDTVTQIRDRDVKLCGVASLAEMDYEANTFWVKTTAPVDAGMVSVVRADGSPADVSVTGFSFNSENFGYTLNLSRPVTLDDLSGLRIRVNGSDCKIEPDGYIFYSDRFHSDYTYNGDDLGATWTKNGTTFKAWAPTAWDVKLIRYSAGNGNFDAQGYDQTWIEEIDMVRGDKGVWSVTVPGDLHGTYYNYKVTFANRTHEAVDPYAKSTGIDGYRSMVLNMAATNPEGWDNDISPNQGMSYTDAIIYEMHIREYTAHSTSGVKEEWRGKYLGMTQEGTSYQGHATGLDHLKQLGVTHVQIMPFNDFEASISETDAVNMGEDLYGWGYNPKNFNTPEGSYATDPFNGEVRVNELKQMIQALHSNGINVIMDSVYNHVYDGGGFSYNRLVPSYFSRFHGENDDWSKENHCNSSGCGNDFATQRAMARKYIVDSILYWVEEYHVDGFRFDLAGLIDAETMNEAINTVHAKYPSVIFYGEGWEKTDSNMEGAMPVSQYYAPQIPEFAFFNHVIRDSAVGGEHEESGEWGFGMGNSGRAETVMNSMRAINWGWADGWYGAMENPNQVINYVACHDKYTLTDKVWYKTHDEMSGRTDISFDWYKAAANRLTNTVILLSQGIPLMYSGDEMLRQKTKENGWPAHNSGHEKHDDGTDFTNAELNKLNAFDWSNPVSVPYADVTNDYYKGLIEFRKNHAALRCNYIDSDGTPDSKKYTSSYRISDQCIMVYVDGFPNTECSDGILIILNSGTNSQWVNFYDYGIPQGNWQACIHGDKAGVEALWSTTNGTVGVEACSATVLVKGDLIDENSVYNRQASGGSCRHTTHTQDGKCTNCGASVSHTYVSGTCVCGKVQPGSDTAAKTLYVDLTGSSWTNVNIYTWVDGTDCTGKWPGAAMTKVQGSIYSYEVPGSAANIIFNNGTDQTKDMTIPTDGKNLYSYATGTWSTYAPGGDVGDGEPVPDTAYYLIGYINGANYGCEEDYQNMGSYKFVDGKLTARFSEDSYVFVKTEGNGKWLLADAYCELSTCTFKEGGSDKMLVPGGVEVTFTLVENADGSVTVSYTKNAGAVCTHSYIAKVTAAATCTENGVRTYTCSKCGSSYTETIAATGHHYENGTCTSCGAFDGSTALKNTYYLVGWINGANYGCEEDYENNGIYKFVNGQLTATFTEDSYLFVKTENNGKWLLADAYTEASVCTFKEGGSEKLFVPGGVQLFFTVTENQDGSVTVSYTKGDTNVCDHTYTAEVTTEATCTAAGLRTYTCTKCGHSYTQNIAATGHNFFGGSCSVCGAADPNGTPSTGIAYYLVGYINGADHGCEADWQNLGNYKFTNGKLTATFTQDSYVFVKTGDNQEWLLANSYCEASTCTFSTGKTEKMFVPGGVKLTFTLTENADGSVSVTYTSGSTPASTIPTLTLKSPTLEFKDMITINAFYTAENTQDVVEMGMITYTSKVERWSVRTAEHVVPGAVYIEQSGRYCSSSQGIHAKYLADTFYLAVYAKLTDGSYVYSKLAPYSPMTYANSQLKNSTDVKLKQLAVAMLNYGTEAQLFFGHNTGNLANAALNAEHLALPESYRADMVASVPAASAAKQGTFANNSGFSSRYPAISFEGAFCINYFFTPKYTPRDGITLYYWNAADYNAASVLTAANASGSLKLNGSGTGEYRGDITGISAKNLSEAVYVAAVYQNGSTTWTSGVLGYSIGAYCSSQASKGGDIANLAKATAVYGYHAKQYFG